jgi:hypothetical protein
MTIRIDVREDCTIEVMASNMGKRPKHLKCLHPERALILVEYFMKRDLETARNERFIPQIQIEARKAFKKLREKSPYGTETKTGKTA